MLASFLRISSSMMTDLLAFMKRPATMPSCSGAAMSRAPTVRESAACARHWRKRKRHDEPLQSRLIAFSSRMSFLRPSLPHLLLHRAGLSGMNSASTDDAFVAARADFSTVDPDHNVGPTPFMSRYGGTLGRRFRIGRACYQNPVRGVTRPSLRKERDGRCRRSR